jgi:hypothetical protein
MCQKKRDAGAVATSVEIIKVADYKKWVIGALGFCQRGGSA